MSQQNLHEILVCTNKECGLRFPLSPTEKRMHRCPRCGFPLEISEEPYASFAIPQKISNGKGKEFVTVLDNIRSAYNVGSVFRTSDGVGIDKIFLCGITPTPDNPKVGKTALDAEKSVPWEHYWSILDAVRELRSKGFFIVSLEGGNTSVNIFDALPLIRKAEGPVALIVGNEVSGIDPEAVKLSSMCVYIPMEGVKESLNVATAFGVAAYLIRYQGLINE